MATFLTSAFSLETIRQHGLTPDEYEKIKQLLGGREPTLTELGIFSVMWSEHCSYKSSRVHLKRLPTRSKRVLQGPGENAGIIDIGGKLINFPRGLAGLGNFNSGNEHQLNFSPRRNPEHMSWPAGTANAIEGITDARKAAVSS